MSGREPAPGSGPAPPLEVTSSGAPAGGFAALASTARVVMRRMGLRRGVRALLAMNDERGFDCSGCAWPSSGERIDFCENGAKHLAQELAPGRVGPAFFARHDLSDLLARPDRWLEAQGRLAHPMRRAPGAQRYEPIAWDEAFARIAQALHGLAHPDEAVFYTSGRTSNEAAFLYQLFAREYGTNNLPDCSNMCHESSGTALGEVIGTGKGTVRLGDFECADLILILGQNPGSNHPRMLATLERAKRRGCRIIAVNPLRERGLVSFAHPQRPLGLLGRATPLADLHLPVRVGGDAALLLALGKLVLEAEAAAPDRVLDWDFLREHSEGFGAWRDALERLPLAQLVAECGVAESELRRAATLYAGAGRTIACWAMGLTQQRNSVAVVQEIVNLLLLRGNFGKPGAGVCPVRGHSNVQGDRTMGITEKPSPEFLARLAREFGFEPPARHGLDTVAAIRAMHEGRAKVFFALGGNFAVATPDAVYTHEALRRCRLTVQVSTTLNRSHLVTGEEAILLPCLARSERDVQAGGAQLVTVEDSMSVVATSQGQLEPAAAELRSEPAIVAGLARAVLGPRSRVPWEELVADYDRIRERIARVIPGFGDMNRRVRRAGGLELPSPPRARRFETPSGRARFRVHAPPDLSLGAHRFRMTTIRSHDQFNTTVYSEDDRYRGIRGGRRVVLLHPDDLRDEGLAAQQLVDLTSHFEGEQRVLRGFRVVPYALPRGCAATYFPEANAVVPVGSVAAGSFTPTYKAVIISIAPAELPSA